MTTADLKFYKQEILSLLLSSTYINMFSHTDTPFYYKLFQIQWKYIGSYILNKNNFEINNMTIDNLIFLLYQHLKSSKILLLIIY